MKCCLWQILYHLGHIVNSAYVICEFLSFFASVCSSDDRVYWHTEQGTETQSQVYTTMSGVTWRTVHL